MSSREIPEPIPRNPNDRTKKWSIGELVRHEGKWKFKWTNHVRNFDMVLRKWVEDKSKITVEYKSLESQGVKKSQSLKMIVVRQGIDPSTIRKLMGYFVITLVATVPSAPEYEHIFLTVAKGGKRRRRRVDGCFIINDFACTTYAYQKLDWNHPWIKRLPKETRVTVQQAQKMLDSGEVGMIMPEDPNTGTISNKKVVFSKRL